MDENAGREDAGLRKRMRTKGKTAVEDFKLAKKRGVSKKDKGRKAAAQAMKMQFHWKHETDALHIHSHRTHKLRKKRGAPTPPVSSEQL